MTPAPTSPTMPATTNAPTRLARTLHTKDAVVLGLGAMIGAGIFAAVAPAARAAGEGLLMGLAIAAVIAWLNASSMARLATAYPQSGGAYVYGRERLGPFWGFLAGFGFIAGKLASCAAMAMTFGAYAFPAHAHLAAACAAGALTLVNVLGVQKTMWMTRAIVAVVVVVLAVVVAASLAGGGARLERVDGVLSGGWRGTLEAAGLLFFAFAGYARVATLGEEVVDPAKTIPRAIPLALGIVLVVYAVVMATALACVGADALATSTAPLALAVQSGAYAWASPIVRVGAAVASLGVLLSLLAGIGRTSFAMASNGDLPRALAAVHPRFRVPHRAELAAGVIVTLAAATLDVRGAIGFSSFCVLTYYAIANAAALRMGKRLAAVGAAGCVIVAVTLPWTSAVAGACVLTCGALAYGVRHALTRRGA